MMAIKLCGKMMKKDSYVGPAFSGPCTSEEWGKYQEQNKNLFKMLDEQRNTKTPAGKQEAALAKFKAQGMTAEQAEQHLKNTPEPLW